MSLVVYRLVHAPVTSEVRAKAGFDSPPGRIFLYFYQSYISEYLSCELTSILLDNIPHHDHSYNFPLQNFVWARKLQWPLRLMTHY